VLLFAPPSPASGDTEFVTMRRLRFQALLCTLRGKRMTGLPCGEVLPAHAKVRLTHAGSREARASLDLNRSTTLFHDFGANHTYPPPYAPACCMYNTCVGKTVAYVPSSDDDDVYATTKTIFAVWPEDADIGLVPGTPETPGAVLSGNAPRTGAVAP